MVCYLLSTWQLQVKQSRPFTGTSFLERDFPLAKLYLKEKDKNHDNDTKL